MGFPNASCCSPSSYITLHCLHCFLVSPSSSCGSTAAADTQPIFRRPAIWDISINSPQTTFLPQLSTTCHHHPFAFRARLGPPLRLVNRPTAWASQRIASIPTRQCNDDANRDHIEPPIPFVPTPFLRLRLVQIILRDHYADSPKCKCLLKMLGCVCVCVCVRCSAICPNGTDVGILLGQHDSRAKCGSPQMLKPYDLSA